MDIRPFLEKKIWNFFFGIFQNIPRVPPSYEKIFWVIKNYFTIFPILTDRQLKDWCKNKVYKLGLARQNTFKLKKFIREAFKKGTP